MSTQSILAEFRKKYVSEWIVDDGADNLLWNRKAPTPNEVLSFLEKAIEEARREGFIDGWKKGQTKGALDQAYGQRDILEEYEKGAK